MPCEVTKIPGGVAIICRCGQRRPSCQVPQCDMPAAVLCDFPVVRQHKPATCDLRLCLGHATRIDKEQDLCPAHAKIFAEVTRL